MFKGELKKEVLSHLKVSLVWLVVVTLIRWQWRFNLVWFWLGGLIGTYLLDIDHIINTLFVFPNTLTGRKLKELLGKGRFKEFLILLGETHYERMNLTFHNALFQPIFYVFCFFILTSSGSLFGKGLVMAMALHLLKDEFEELINKKEEHLRQWLFWQIKREVTFKEQGIFLAVMLATFLGLNLLLV